MKSFKDFVKHHGQKAADAINRIAEPAPDKNFKSRQGESYKDQMNRKKHGDGIMGKIRSRGLIMKSFAQFLIEMPWINPDIESDKLDSRHEPGTDSKNRTTISKMSSGHIVKIKYHPGDEMHETYTAHGPDDAIHMEVGGHNHDDKFHVTNLNAYKGSTIQAHELYHHLITHHGIHLHSDYEQSEGGMKVWKKLHKMPDIHMQSFNGSSEKYSELKPSFQRKYDMDSSTRLAAKKK
jgi:hypothetical protein